MRETRPNTLTSITTANCVKLNCSVGEDAWESFGQQGDQTSSF